MRSMGWGALMTLALARGACSRDQDTDGDTNQPAACDGGWTGDIACTYPDSSGGVAYCLEYTADDEAALQALRDSCTAGGGTVEGTCDRTAPGGGCVSGTEGSCSGEWITSPDMGTMDQELCGDGVVVPPE